MKNNAVTADRRGLTLIELLTVVTILGVLIALLLPAVQAARGAAGRVQCQNNLKQIGIGLHHYHDVWQVFPAGLSILPVRGDSLEHGDSGWAWGAKLLPYLEHASLYNAANFEFTVLHPCQRTVSSAQVDAFLCPAGGGGEGPVFLGSLEPGGDFTFSGFALGQYVASAGGVQTDLTEGNGVFFQNSRIAIPDMRDGTNATIMIGERSRNVAEAVWSGVLVIGPLCTKPAWPNRACASAPLLVMSRTDGSNSSTPNAPDAGPDGFWSRHHSGCNFLFGDGSVRFLKETIDPALFSALTTREGGEIVGTNY